MAPEQVRGDAVDARADVWAVGVVLFEMLAGRRPFVGDDTTELLRAILQDPAPDLRALRPEVPPALARTVARALAKSPADRHASAAALSAELRAAHRASVIGREAVVLAGRRTRLVVAGAVLVALVAIGAAGWHAWSVRSRDVAMRDTPLGGTSTTGVATLVARARDRYHQRTEEGTEEAIALLATALARESADASAHALLARALVRATQPAGAREGQVALLDSAEVHARRAIALAPRRPDVHAALGNVLAAQRRHPEAVAQLQRALDLDPRDVQATMDLSASWSALGRTDEAMVLTERALAIDPVFPEAREIAVARYRGLGMWPEARRHAAEGLTRDPTSASLQWQSTLLALDEGDTAAARRALDSTLAVRSGAEQVRLRGWFEMYRGDPRAARPWVERVVATGSASYDRYMYGSVLLLTGDRQRGDSLLRLEIARLTSQRARSAGTTRQLGLLLASLHSALGERELALAALERWLAEGGKYHWTELERWPNGWGALWAPLKDDPRFREIVAVSRRRLAETQARIRVRVSGLPSVP
jgi:tetratricopeptide (TPR) repeat protein